MGTTVARQCIQRFSSLSLSNWPALECAGFLMKERIEISIPPKPAGREEGHLLKCHETVVSL